MMSYARISTSVSITTFTNPKFATPKIGLKPLALLNHSDSVKTKSSVVLDSLKLLEWDKVCDSVSSFAGTALGKKETKAQLWNLDRTYEDSVRLLEETNAAVEMLKYGKFGFDFHSLDLLLVDYALQHARRGLPVEGSEAMAVVALLEFSEALQSNLKAAIKEDAEWYKKFMPLSEMISELVWNRGLIKTILQVVDEDGSVKDSASSDLRRSRDQVRMLERKEVSNINGRFCLNLGTDQAMNINGLLLTRGNILEPLSAVPLNDELQQARASVAKAEAEVLSRLTEKIRADLEQIENLLGTLVQLDMVHARASYGLSFGGASPALLFFEKKGKSSTDEFSSSGNVASQLSKREWTLYLPKVYHPLLLMQHRENLRKAKKDVSNAIAEIKRRKMQGLMAQKQEKDIDIPSLEFQVTKLEQAHPVPVDFFIAHKTRVLVITGPNTGGKTICLKTLGLAAMMAKSGLHVLSSESVQIPWFDYVFADVGDEQSLTQSLSTFSGHLKQISEIRAQSTSQSLVLLDEVGAGTNPLEGAALGMSLLESFAEDGALLTIATTHHGELKTLKYSNDAFENACVEFDEVNLKPTYKILWGIPGRSNAINISERLGLPNHVLENARQLYGAASAEINEVITDMERFKLHFQEHVCEAENYLMLSRSLHESILVTKEKVVKHGSDRRLRMMREISEAAAVARSILHKRAREFRAIESQSLQLTSSSKGQPLTSTNIEHITSDNSEHSVATKSAVAIDDVKPSHSEKRRDLPKVGDLVHVFSLGKQATVIDVEPSKEEIVVQAGWMKMNILLEEYS
ncbi:MutS2 and Smr-associated SH3 domain [Dillenia turbinata]|uniref:MutS2 and Smr-associated SH3 domain n=1 Tax=Dillenia turbinata TaxID=194707 RepID=A0AAN8Z4E6_9MAGN